MRRFRGRYLAISSLVVAAVIASAALAISARRPQTIDPVTAFNRGLALLDQLKFDEAAAAFRSVIDLDPDFVAARTNLGIALFYDRKLEQAQTAMQSVLARQPNQLHAHYVLGLIASTRGEGAAAVEHFESVRRQDPDDASTHYYLGRLQLEHRNYEAAAAHFREVIAIEPYNASAHYNLATALLRARDRAAAQASMREFQRLQGLFGSRTIGLRYLEQGKYAAALDQIPQRYAVAAADERFSVHFADVAEESGIRFLHSGTGTTSLQVSSGNDLEARIAGWIGSGLAFGDFDDDNLDDLFVADAGGNAPSGRLYRNRGDRTFEDVTAATGVRFEGPTAHPLWGDLDQDGLVDLYLVNYGQNRAYRNLGGGRFEDTSQQWGVADSRWGLGGALVDADHDGDLDIFVANFINVDQASSGRFPVDFPGAPNVLYRNNGNGTFTDISAISGIAARAERSTAVVASDLDDGRDIDFYVVNWGSPNRLLKNLRDGTFRVSSQANADGAGTGPGLAIGSVSGQGPPDILLAGDRRTQILRNRGSARFRSETLDAEAHAHGMQLLDLDNDGDLDLVLLEGLGLDAGFPTGGGLRLFENRGGRFFDVSSAAGLDVFAGVCVRGLSASDYDTDGDLDLAISVCGDRPLLLRNEGGNRGNWLSIRPQAVNSNSHGIGIRAELLTGTRRQRLELTSGSGFMSSLPPRAHFGLGRYTAADAVRLMWPNGVLQTEIDQPVNQQISIRELNRKGTSCPILYVWDGEQYRFQTDFLGGSAYGYQLSPGVFNTPDTDEYIRLEPDQMALRDGKVAVTLNNQLEEVIFFDRLQLLAIDHPASYEVFPDEKLLPGPPFDPFRVVTASRPRPPASAVDGLGRDQLEALLHIDRRYADIVRPLPFKGYAREHELILDLGETACGDIWLLAYAWIDYADSTSNLAAAQAGLKLKPPELDVLDSDGRWVTAIERLGFPAGLPKTMTINLTDRFLSESRKVRIRTNMRIHWDQILVIAEPQQTDYRIHRLEPGVAVLSEQGFPAIVWPDGREPRLYDHSRRSQSAEWKVHVGAYTREGDVRPLLTETDDRYVVTRSGDQIEALFDVSSLPEISRGWMRSYLLYIDGFGKDMDPNSAAPHTVGPLPFHGVSFPYPPEQGYASDPEHLKYLETWNTRLIEMSVAPLRYRKADSEKRNH